jgi:hypothetical protein
MANSQGYTVSQSMWALDAVENFTTSPIYTSADANTGAPGELQNDYSQCFGSSVFDTDYHMKVSINLIETLSGAYGARLYNSKIDTGGPENAQTFAEYAVGSAASGALPNAYSISAWVYPAAWSVPPSLPQGSSDAKKYHIASFQSSDHLTSSTGLTPATCSVRLFLTGSSADGGSIPNNVLYVGTETVLSTSAGFINDLATSSVSIDWNDQWHHILCCYDATTPDINSEMTDRIKLYIDGNLVSLITQSTNYLGSEGAFYGEIHPSTGAIGHNAGLNTDFATLTSSQDSSIGANDGYINNVFQGRITEVSFFNYSLHSYNTELPPLMYNNGCPPKMSSLPVFDSLVQRPVGYYRCGGIDLPTEPVFPGPVGGVEGGPDVEGSSSWDPDVAPTPPVIPGTDTARLINAVGFHWGDYSDSPDGTQTFYPKGDGYPAITIEDSTGVFEAFIDYANAGSDSGPCKDGYDAPDKNNLIAAPIYNRKHSLASAFSVTQYGWGLPKVDYPSSQDYQDRTLTMPIPEVSAALGEWADTWPLALIVGPIANEARKYPLGKIQTCGGNAEWESGPLAGYVRNNSWISSSQAPFYDSYDNYNQIMRLVNKDYSVIPEFLISDQIEYYFNKQRGDFLSPNSSQFAIKGTSTSSTSDIPSNSSEEAFYETFSNSDFLRNFSVIKQDHKGFADPTTITLKCKALMKFLPYDGFFPSERSLQIANQFSKSYGDFMEYTGLDKSLTSARFRPFLTPFFRPGIVYNTIKSGLAVDFPIYTSSYQVIQYRTALNSSSSYYALGTQDTYSSAGTLGELPTASWDLRIPFEAVIEPEKYVKDVLIYDLEPHPSSAIDIQAKWTGEGDVLYKRMMHNYLAAIPEFFLPNGEFTSLKSQPESEFLTVQSGTSYGMRVKVRSTMNKPRLWRAYTSNNSVLSDYECPQHPRNLTGDAENLRETFTMYSRPSAYGPPVAATDYLGFRDDILPTDARNVFYNTDLFPSDSLMGINPSFCPAPIGGEAWVDIVWKAPTGGRVTIDQIFSEATINKWRIDADPILNIGSGSATGSLYGSSKDQAIWSSNEAEINYSTPMRTSYANAYAMQLDASFNILGKVGDRWVIEPKMETPHYNFNSETSIRPLASASNTLTIPTNGSESVPRGMWHQFGTIETDKGTYLEVGEIPESWRTTRGYADPNRPSPSGSSGTGSFNVELLSGIDLNAYQNDNFKDLSKLVGFEKSKKLGNTATAFTVSEAIVAVPFILEDGEKKFFQIPENVIRRALGDLNTIGSDKAVSQAGLGIKAALKGIDNNADLFSDEADLKAAKIRAAAGAAASAASSQLDRDEDTSDKVSDTIKDMVSKMKKFVFPPNMDFVNNLGKVTPFSMYIFEFDYQFEQTDLAYIWQNVAPPNKKKNFEQKEVQITHKLYANELMGSFGDGENDPMKDGLQWMVFKVKQRASNNYFSKVSSTTGPKSEQFPVSYNWPYDFFSLVEFANMDAKVGFGKGLKDGSVDQRVAETKENPLRVAKKGKGIRKGRKKLRKKNR